MSKELLERFFGAVNRQFSYGGVKYAQTSEKEATDVLFDDFGANWLFGTIAKYCKRFSNLAREKDLMKIACYMFILWLKRGFHLNEKGTPEIINTTVEVKSKYFNVFKERFVRFISFSKLNQQIAENPIQRIYDLLFAFGNIEFNYIHEEDLFEIFYHAFCLWCREIPDDKKETDEDVYNERKNKE